MKIDEVEVGAEYAYQSRWGTDKLRRLRALEVTVLPEDPNYRHSRKIRKVRCERLDWDTGEPAGKEEVHPARDLELFQPVKDRLDAEAARERQQAELVKLTGEALDRLGVAGRVVAASYHAGVIVHLSPDEVAELHRVALIS